MPKHKVLKHQQKIGLKSWLMISGLMSLVMFMLVIAKLGSSQDIRQKAMGHECYLAVKDSATGSTEIIEGSGGRQQIAGVNYCVGGVGNDADRYSSFYDSKIAGQADLNNSAPPCNQTLINGYKLGDKCTIEGKSGKVICVAGPKEEYLGCIGGSDKSKFYTRLLTQKRKLSPTAQLTPTPSPRIDQLKDWRQLPITLEINFLPQPAFDPTKAEKNQWSNLALFINNGSKINGAYDQANCDQLNSTSRTPKSENRFMTCGTANQYLDRLWDNFEVKPKKNKTLVTKRWSFRAGDLLIPTNKTNSRWISKLSLVFYNGYWDGDQARRAVAIKSIKFLAPDGQELLSFTPSDSSFWLKKKHNYLAQQSFYFDLGLVNDQGKKDQYQDGFTKAFDKKQLADVIENKSTTLDYWMLDSEGSFNLVTTNLYPKIRNFFKSYHHSVN